MPPFLRLEFSDWRIFQQKKMNLKCFLEPQLIFICIISTTDFFLFSCVGLLLISLKKYGIQISEKMNKTIFFLLFIGCFFGYGLSILWTEIPDLLYGFFTIISLIQLFGAWKLWNFVWENRVKLSGNDFIQKLLWAVVGFSFLMKFILQTASAIPALGVFAFSNINIVIAYLHLVLLMGISLFLIWKILQLVEIEFNKLLKFSILLLVFGIVCNEIVLALSGIFSIFYIPFLSAKYWLLFVSVVIMISIGIFIKSLKLN